MSSRFPQLRTVLAPEYANLPDAVLRAELRSALGPEMSPEELEFSLAGVGRAFGEVGKAVAKHAPAVLSGVAKGAAAGSMLGPYGALAGALMGGIGSGLQSASRPQSAASRVGSVLGGVTSLAGLAPGAKPGGGIGQPFAGLSPVAQAMRLLDRPEVRKAVTAMALGRMGRESIPVETQSGAVDIPVQAFADLLQLALRRLAGEDGKQMRKEFAEAGEMVDSTDISTARAELLAELLEEAVPANRSWQRPRANRARRPPYEYAEWIEQMHREDAEYDALELLDLELWDAVDPSSYR